MPERRRAGESRGTQSQWFRVGAEVWHGRWGSLGKGHTAQAVSDCANPFSNMGNCGELHSAQASDSHFSNHGL